MKYSLFILFIFFIGCFIYTYFLYPVILKIIASIFYTPVKTDSSYLPTIAVVVPVYNEELVLQKKIDNLLSMQYAKDRFQIWIGSDCSNDKSETIARQYENKGVRLFVSTHRIGKAGVLNAMVPRIDADIVLFTDADITFHEDCLLHIARNFADPAVGGVAGNTTFAGTSPIYKEEKAYRTFEANQKRLESMLHSTISAFGSFYAIRKSLFVQFPENTYSNDDVIMPMNIIRQGYRMIFEPLAISEESVNSTTTIEFNRRIRIGTGNFQSFFWLLDFLNPLKGWPFFCYMSHKVLRWFSPLSILGIYICSAIIAYLYASPVIICTFIGFLFLPLLGLTYRIVPFRFIRSINYFFLMNVAILIGLYRYLLGVKSAVWSPTKR